MFVLVGLNPCNILCATGQTLIFSWIFQWHLKKIEYKVLKNKYQWGYINEDDIKDK